MKNFNIIVFFSFPKKKKTPENKLTFIYSRVCVYVYIYTHEKINNILLKQQNHLIVCDLFSKCVSQRSGYGGGKEEEKNT